MIVEGLQHPPEITARDREILDMDVEGYDSVQVVLSRLEPAFYGSERKTYVSRSLPVKAVREYLRGLRNNAEAVGYEEPPEGQTYSDVYGPNFPYIAPGAVME